MDAHEDKTIRSALAEIWRIIGFLKPFKKQFFLVLFVVTVGNVFLLGRPYVVGWGLNHLRLMGDPQAAPTAASAPAAPSPSGEASAGVSGEAESLSLKEKLVYILIAVVVYLVCGLGSAVLQRVQPVVSTRLSVSLLRRLRTMVYGKTQQLSFNYLDRLTNGQIIERATGDVTQIQNFLTMSFVQVFDAVITIIVMLFFMMSMNVELALVAMLPFPLVMYVFAKISRLIRIRSRHTRDQADVMTTRLAEGIAGVRVIRSFGTETMVSARYRESLVELYHRAMRMFKLRCFGMMAVFNMSRLVEILMVAYGGMIVIRGRGLIFDQSLSLGFFITYLFYVGMFIWKVHPLMEVGASAQEARAAFERIAALMDARPDVADSYDATDLPAGGGRVEFRNVSFAYQDAPHPEADVTERMIIETPPSTPEAVRDLNLTIAPGEIIALVGPTGSGKSTVVNLLPRFYDPTGGSIFIDGRDIRDVRLENLRRNIALVFQETFLFRGTIAENIAYGLPRVDRAAILEAARLAQVDEFIQELPLGYDSPIGERGVMLSGGQRQRLAIARAILMKPRVLILDDATASVDPATEYRIRQGLRELMDGRTTLLIAHRLPTIRAADRVVVLNEGCVEDIGTHEELLVRNAFYQTLYQAQMDEISDGETPA